MPGAGAPKKRFCVRTHLRRELETPFEEQCPVVFTPAQEIARQVVTELREMRGRDLVQSLATAVTTAYGTLAVNEDSDHLAGSAARAKVDSLLAQADELRRRSKGL